MSAKATQVTADAPAENKKDVEAAYEAVGEALKALSVTNERYADIQQHYFDLKAAALARDEDFQEIVVSGTDLYVPSSHASVGDNPTVQDNLGEVELPTRGNHFSVLGTVTVADPENPHVSRAVHIDHVITTDGTVRVEVNSDTLDKLSGGE